MQTMEPEVRFAGYERRRRLRLPWFALACTIAAVGFGYAFVRIAVSEDQSIKHHATSAQPTTEVRNLFNDW